MRETSRVFFFSSENLTLCAPSTLQNYRLVIETGPVHICACAHSETSEVHKDICLLSFLLQFQFVDGYTHLPNVIKSVFILVLYCLY